MLSSLCISKSSCPFEGQFTMLVCGSEPGSRLGIKSRVFGACLVCDLPWAIGREWFALMHPVQDSCNQQIVILYTIF